MKRFASIITCFASGLLCSAELWAQTDVTAVALRAAEQTIRPGDRIELTFLRDRELNATVTVNERGETVFPKLGTTDLRSVTIGALRDTLTARYSEYLRDADLGVSVLRRVVVLGEVRTPGVYYLDVTSSVRDAIAQAGGVLETGNKNKVTIVRGSQKTRARRWESDQGPANDLQSGDQVVVARKPWLVLNALPVISTSVIVIGLIRSLRN